MSDGSRRVVALVGDGLATFEFGLVSEVFGLDRPELDGDWYRFTVASMDSGLLRATGGVKIQVTRGLRSLANADTIVVPGWKHLDKAPPTPVLEALRRAHDRGARLLSICSGAFVLAATGLLDGLTATTHWRYADQLARAYPRVRVDRDVLYVDEGSIITSAGSAAGIDACLHVVRIDFGADVANMVARRLVVQPQREGGQRQYIESPHPPEHQESLAPVLDWAIEHIDQEITIEALARRAAMSTRTLSRRFAEQVGSSPYAWLTAQRVVQAQRLLETTGLSIDAVARGSGFATAATLRHHFGTALGTTPTAYRRHFTAIP